MVLKNLFSKKITKILLLAAVLVILVMLISTYFKIAAAKELNASLSTSIAITAQENAAMKYDIEHSTENETIERVARGNSGLVNSDEVIYYDMASDTAN